MNARLLVEDDARGHEQLAEAVHIDAPRLRLREVDAAQLQQLDAVLRVHVVRQPELPAVRSTQLLLIRQALLVLEFACTRGTQ